MRPGQELKQGVLDAQRMCKLCLLIVLIGCTGLSSVLRHTTRILNSILNLYIGL